MTNTALWTALYVVIALVVAAAVARFFAGLRRRGPRSSRQRR